VIKILHEDRFLEQVRRKGRFWQDGLWQLSREYPGLVREVRGLGLISCLELQLPRAQDIQRLCQARGLLINAIGEQILRFLPPLVISIEQLQKALDVLRSIFQEIADSPGPTSS
jgi:acetylornithine/succinyldiaminopimelate/putrescine aminotransferase